MNAEWSRLTLQSEREAAIEGLGGSIESCIWDRLKLRAGTHIDNGSLDIGLTQAIKKVARKLGNGHNIRIDQILNLFLGAFVIVATQTYAHIVNCEIKIDNEIYMLSICDKFIPSIAIGKSANSRSM